MPHKKLEQDLLEEFEAILKGISVLTPESKTSNPDTVKSLISSLPKAENGDAKIERPAPTKINHKGHPVVTSHAMGKKFRYCRECKIEVFKGEE